MTDPSNTPPASAAQAPPKKAASTQIASRMKFQGIIEADAIDEPPATPSLAGKASPPNGAPNSAVKDASGDQAGFNQDWRNDGQPMVAIPLGADQRNWNVLSRQVWQASRLASILVFFAIIAGWPVGTYFSHLSLYGVSSGWLSTFRSTLEPSIVVFAFLTPVLLSLCGYFLSHAYKMLYAAESIASAAQQFLNPAQNATDNAVSVGAAVRSQLDALNAGIDGALQRLAGVESMIRQHVEVIETAGEAIQTRTTGVVDKVATERARLIDLTESLNNEADAFAAAIAERAQTSIESLNNASSLSDKSETRFEERITHLEAAAAKALSSFEALHNAIEEADNHMRDAAVSLEETSEKTRAAGDAAAKSAQAAAASVEEKATALQSSSEVAAQAIKKVADDTFAAAKDASDAAMDSAAKEAEQRLAERAERIVEETSKALGGVNEAAKSVLHEAAEQAASANESAKTLSQSASESAEAAAKASSDIVKSNEEAQKAASDAAAQAQETAAQIAARSQALAEARHALETENARLEALITEQRKRADRLANAIAAQTDRLSKLAETQLREQEAAEREQQNAPASHEAPFPASNAYTTPPHANNAPTAPAGPTENVTPFAGRVRYDQTQPPTATPPAGAQPTNQTPNQPAPKQPASLSDGTPSGRPHFSANTQGTNRDAQPPQKTNPGARPPMNSSESNSSAKGEHNRQSQETQKPNSTAQGVKDPSAKDNVSWREILSATDEAAPLDLQKGPPPGQSAAFAMNIISNLQDFTMSLETRLYGEPPRALLERFERGDRNVFANRLLRLNEADVKRRIRMESGRDKGFEQGIHQFLQGFERLLEDATTSQTADEELEEYLSSPLGRVYLLIGATVGYFA